jgi:NAD(P)H dehydrogenase (quinone)
LIFNISNFGVTDSRPCNFLIIIRLASTFDATKIRKMILVTGATGPLGASVTAHLLKSTQDVRMLVRNAEKAKPAGAEVALGDYDDYASLIAAMQGVDKLFLVSGNDIDKRAQQHSNVIKAAKEAGVKRIVYVSLQRKDASATSPVADKTIAHLETEQLLQTTGITYTVLQYALYAEMIPVFAGDQVMNTKMIYLPAGEGNAAYAVRADLGEAGANVILDDSGKYDNKFIELSGPAAVSWKEIAEIISGITGQTITYVSPSVEEFKATLLKAGAPEWLPGALAGMQKAVEQGEYERVTDDLEKILGRKPLTVAEYLQSVY